MDFNSIGEQIASSTGIPMSIDAPNGNPMFAYQSPKTGWEITDEPEVVGKKLKGVEFHPCQFKMVSKDSREYRRRTAELYRMAKSHKKHKFSDVEIEAVKTVAACIVGWDHMVWDDSPNTPESKTYLMKFSEDNLMTVLFGYRIALDKANDFIDDRANFFANA